jgi:hypothetical protein
LLSSYPDYGKAPKPYLLSIAEILGQLSEDVVVAVLDLKTGVRARCSYLPTVADIVKCAEEYIVHRDRFRSAPRGGIHKLLPRATDREPTEAEKQRARENWAKVMAEWAKLKANWAMHDSKKPSPMMVPEGLSNEEAAKSTPRSGETKLGTD